MRTLLAAAAALCLGAAAHASEGAPIILYATYCAPHRAPPCPEAAVMPFRTVAECQRMAQPVLAGWLASLPGPVSIPRYRCAPPDLET